MLKLQFEITTPERNVLKEEIDSVTIPTREGEITILPGHIALVAILKPGELIVKKYGKESYMAVSGGFIEVQALAKSTRVIVLADTAERAEELSIQAIEEAKERAQHELEEKRNVDDVAAAGAAASLERELARLKVARRHHKGKSSGISE
jgi:F-type H+-transporting ATPase subunit epsilon